MKSNHYWMPCSSPKLQCNTNRARSIANSRRILNILCLWCFYNLKFCTTSRLWVWVCLLSTWFLLLLCLDWGRSSRLARQMRCMCSMCLKNCACISSFISSSSLLFFKNESGSKEFFRYHKNISLSVNYPIINMQFMLDLGQKGETET